MSTETNYGEPIWQFKAFTVRQLGGKFTLMMRDQFRRQIMCDQANPPAEQVETFIEALIRDEKQMISELPARVTIGPATCPKCGEPMINPFNWSKHNVETCGQQRKAVASSSEA